ncbi:MAG: transglycosylase domain-containing protein [Christensenellales bacterium]
MADASKNKSNRKSFGKVIARLTLAVVIAGFIAVCGFGLFAVSVWGSYDREKLENYAQSTFIYDENGQSIDSLYGSENRVNIEIDDLPLHVKNAFVAAEDIRFYHHHGIDPIRMVGSMIQNIKTNSLSQGASTITQQLVKLTHFSSEKLWSRKFNEIYYALLVDRDYEKDDILQMYMNYVYFGNGAYGIQSAAVKYFGINASELSLDQAACLAAVLKAPSNYSPHIDAQANKKRRDMIIGIMLEENMISEKEAQSAFDAPIKVIDIPPGENYGWFVDEAINQAVMLLNIDMQELLSGGYHIHTTLDISAYISCENAAMEITSAMPDAPSGESAQCAIVLMEKDGAVRAMIGGSEYTTARGLNRAMVKRQPGSALKPLAVYSPAIEIMGLQTVTFLDDSPKDFDGYSPSNYGGTYNGYIPLRTAFEKSLNIPAVSIVSDMGVGSSIDYLRKFGIDTESSDRYLPLALGSMTYGTSPYELCAAYLAFINDGIHPQPYMITKISDSGGKTIFLHEAKGNIAISPSTAYIITDMMRSTVLNGTARRLSALGYPIGAKTGTVGFEEAEVKGNRDAWSVAVTPGHAVAVWIGFDSTTRETHLDSSVTGSNQPTQTILEIMSSYLPGGEGDFFQPEGVIRLNLDAKTLWETGRAYLATDITPNDFILSEVFWSSNRPYEDSPYWKIPSAPYDLRITNSSSWNPQIIFTSTSQSARYSVYRTAGNSTQLVDTVEGVPAGVEIIIDDDDAKWLMRNDYYVVAEHALAADYGIEAASAPSSTISFRPFFSPFGWNLDF